MAHETKLSSALLKTAHLALVGIDADGLITEWGGAAESVYGWAAHECLGKPVTMMWPPDAPADELGEYEWIFDRVEAEYRSWRYRKDGSRFFAEVHAKSHFDADGSWLGSVALVRDASTELGLLERVQSAEGRFTTAFTAAALPLVICDLDATIVESNEAYRKLASRLDPPPLVRLLDLIEPEHRPPIAAALGTLAAERGRFEGIEVPIAGSDNHILNLSIAPVDEGPDAPPLAFIQLIDVSDQLRIQAELAEIATIDPLTGAFNRSCLEPLLASFTPGTDLGVLFVDLDDFKDINDTHGHGVGDSVLETMGARLDAVVRESDYVIRYGGDEFVIICPTLADSGAARRLGDRLRASVETPVSVDGAAMSITASVGIALTTVPEGETDFDAVIAHADSAMYEAKSAGRNTTVV